MPAKLNPDGSIASDWDIQLTGSNVEGTIGVTAPSKGVLIGGKSQSGLLISPRADDVSGDGYGSTDKFIYVSNRPYTYNESTWDRQRGNTQGALLASAARTGTVSSPNQTNYNARGVVVFLRVTVASGTGGLQVVLRGFDPVEGSGYQLNALPTAIIITGWHSFILYPGATVSGADVRQTTASVLPRVWGLQVVHGDATSYTYSIGHSLIL